MGTSSLASLNAKIFCAIDRYNMLENIHSVIIGVSGGADSMALLRFFEDYARKNDLKIVAAHVNHCLRGEEAERDEAFVRTYCKTNSVQLEACRVDVNEVACRDGLGIEECARRIRYEFFKRLAATCGGVIATAHTLSDSVETALINLSRGTGPAGLCGIPPKRGNIIRPLILMKRAETKLYCELSGISYVTDSTNLLPTYTRNKVRLEVVPLLKELNSSFEDNAARSLAILRADEEYLNSIAMSFVNEYTISPGVFDLSNVMTQPLPILSRVVRLIIFEFITSNVSAHHIELVLNIIKNNSGAVTLPGKFRLSVKDNILKVQKELTKIKVPLSSFECAFAEGITLTESGEEFIIKVLDREKIDSFVKKNKIEFFYTLDYAKITPNAKFRYRRAEDKFCQAGRNVTKSIKKLFNELNVPRENREKIFMLANENEILWINEIGVSQQVTVTENTKKVALIYAKEKNKCYVTWKKFC